jgi:transcription antitermination factor NusG
MAERHKDSGAITEIAHCAPILDQGVERWAAIRTSARWEKKAVLTLARAGIPVFLPTWTRISRYRTRKNISQIPLFPGYLFFDESCTEKISRLSPATKRFVAQIIKPSDYVTLKSELREISEIITNHQLVKEKIFGIPGETVRITRGSFKNFEGKIARQIDASNRFVLVVSFLGLSVEVEVEDQALEKIL